MGSLVCFATSKKVTSELFQKLNIDRNEGNDYPSFNVFNPARHEPGQILDDTEDRETHLDFDVFNESDEALQQLIQDKFPAYKEANKWVDANKFAVLDDRSTQDNTVFIWSKEPIFELDEQVGSHWLSWRVSFPDGHEMATHLVFGSAEIIDQVYEKRKERFTNQDGVFELQKAMKAWGDQE